VARPRIFTDDEILDHLGTALKDATGSWTLAGAAAAVGLHPATLIKRFGSRHGLLVALSRRWVAAQPSAPASADPYEELLSWARSSTPSGASGTQLLARIDMLAEDLRDPELRALLRMGWRQNLLYLTSLVERSQAAGRISSSLPPQTAAQLLLDAAHGALLRSAVEPEPTGTVPIQSLLEALT